MGNLLQYKRDIPLGAEGITIIDVGGKDEVDIMYKLCQLLNINACCIVDMDALFEGRIRQTASKNEQTTKFLVIKGKDTLDKEIGKLERLLDEIANELVQLQNDLALKGEMKHLLDLLEELTEKNKKTMYRKVLFLGLHRIGQEIKKVISSDNQTKMMKINGLAKDIFECFESINIFILEKGEIENYYLTPINDHYQIPDNKKTEYFLQENQRIDDMKKTEIENNYKDIINILDKVCFLTSVNTTKFVCAKIGDWIHNVQSLVKIEPNISEDVLINNPKADWDNFKRIIKIEEFQANNGKLSCKFRIINDLVPDSHEYSFSEDTVAANFQV